MGQSLASTYIHLVFGTKGRYPFIKEGVDPFIVIWQAYSKIWKALL